MRPPSLRSSICSYIIRNLKPDPHPFSLSAVTIRLQTAFYPDFAESFISGFQKWFCGRIVELEKGANSQISDWIKLLSAHHSNAGRSIIFGGLKWFESGHFAGIFGHKDR